MQSHVVIEPKISGAGSDLKSKNLLKRLGTTMVVSGKLKLRIWSLGEPVTVASWYPECAGRLTYSMWQLQPAVEVNKFSVNSFLHPPIHRCNRHQSAYVAAVSTHIIEASCCQKATPTWSCSTVSSWLRVWVSLSLWYSIFSIGIGFWAGLLVNVSGFSFGNKKDRVYGSK